MSAVAAVPAVLIILVAVFVLNLWWIKRYRRHPKSEDYEMQSIPAAATAKQAANKVEVPPLEAANPDELKVVLDAGASAQENRVKGAWFDIAL
ncbi:hypothetical protein ACEPAH_9640 [Sanghuangporus vaninii]